MMRFKWGLFVVVVFLAMSCQKVQEDKIPPIIVLNGSNPDTVLVGCTYKDPGAKTSDDKPGHDYRVSDEINTNTTGYDTLHYIAVDADSNYAYEQRIVVVVPLDENIFLGNFHVIDTLVNIPWIVTNYLVSVEKISSTLFRMSNFNNFGNSFQLFIQPDTTGSFILDYNLADTIIQGQGIATCNGRGFKISCTVEASGNLRSHRANYKK